MRETVFKNKWLVLLLLAAALALLTRFIGGGQQTPAEAGGATLPVPESHATDQPKAAASTDENEPDEEDYIDPGLGDDSSGFDPTPDAENLLNPPLDPSEDALEIEPLDPIGEDPTPVD